MLLSTNLTFSENNIKNKRNSKKKFSPKRLIGEKGTEQKNLWENSENDSWTKKGLIEKNSAKRNSTKRIKIKFKN
jgi:streptomycin 6-kinase